MNQEVLAAKKQQVEDIKAKITSAQSLVIIDYMGLTVAEDTAFRKELRDNGVDYAVLRNRLVKIAFNELGYTEFDEALNGPTAVAFSSTDAVAPAKYIVKNIKALNKMKTNAVWLKANSWTKLALRKSQTSHQRKSCSQRCSAVCNHRFQNLLVA